MRQKTNVLLNFIGKQNCAKNSIFLYVLSVEAKYPHFSFSFCSSFVPDMITFHIYGYSRSSLAKLGFLVPGTTFSLEQECRTGITASNGHGSIPLCMSVQSLSSWKAKVTPVLTLDSLQFVDTKHEIAVCGIE